MQKSVRQRLQEQREREARLKAEESARPKASKEVAQPKVEGKKVQKPTNVGKAVVLAKEAMKNGKALAKDSSVPISLGRSNTFKDSGALVLNRKKEECSRFC